MPVRPPRLASEPALAGAKAPVPESAQASVQVQRSVQVQVPQELEHEPRVPMVPQEREPVQVQRVLVSQEREPVQRQEQEPAQRQEPVQEPQVLVRRLGRVLGQLLAQLESQGPEQASALAQEQASEALQVKQVQRLESQLELPRRPSRSGVRVQLLAGVAFRRQVLAGRMRVLLEPERERAARPVRLLELRVLAFFS